MGGNKTLNAKKMEVQRDFNLNNNLNNINLNNFSSKDLITFIKEQKAEIESLSEKNAKLQSNLNAVTKFHNIVTEEEWYNIFVDSIASFSYASIYLHLHSYDSKKYKYVNKVLESVASVLQQEFLNKQDEKQEEENEKNTKNKTKFFIRLDKNDSNRYGSIISLIFSKIDIKDPEKKQLVMNYIQSNVIPFNPTTLIPDNQKNIILFLGENKDELLYQFKVDNIYNYYHSKFNGTAIPIVLEYGLDHIYNLISARENMDVSDFKSNKVIDQKLILDIKLHLLHDRAVWLSKGSREGSDLKGIAYYKTSDFLLKLNNTEYKKYEFTMIDGCKDILLENNLLKQRLRNGECNININLLSPNPSKVIYKEWINKIPGCSIDSYNEYIKFHRGRLSYLDILNKETDNLEIKYYDTEPQLRIVRFGVNSLEENMYLSFYLPELLTDHISQENSKYVPFNFFEIVSDKPSPRKMKNPDPIISSIIMDYLQHINTSRT